MSAKSGLTLSEVARLLGQQQHRLIHLCEKGVVRPDLGEARGRGSSRKFSARNVLEFAVAVKLRDLSVPVTAIAAVVHVLRVFEKSVAKELVDFRLPDSLQSGDALDLRAIITDQWRLYFTLHPPRGEPRMYGGVDIERFNASGRSRSPVAAWLKQVRDGEAHAGAAMDPVGTAERGRIEVSITGIARDLSARMT